MISNAWAQGAPAGGAGELMSFLPIVLMFVVLYFLMIRPQMKRQKEHKLLLEGLKSGDEVVTAGGLYGRVGKVGDQHVVLEVGDSSSGPVRMSVQKSSVQTVLPKGTIKEL